MTVRRPLPRSKRYVSRRLALSGLSNLTQWDDAGLHPIMRENVRLCLYDKPTAIQSFALPAVSCGKDLIGIAHTGDYLLDLHLMSLL